MKPTPGPVARFIIAFLKEKGWTQEDLADHLGVDRSAITQWTTGRSMPGDQNLMKLALLANIDPEDLFRLKQAVALAKRGVELPTKSGEILSPSEREILNQFRQGKYQEIIANLVERLTRKNAA